VAKHRIGTSYLSVEIYENVVGYFVDHDVAGLSKSTQMYLTILLYGLPRNNKSRF
jgi:hypothetical protein